MAQSGDPAGIRAYQSGDPYMATGQLMGLAPPGATKRTHPEVRALCKVLVLALGYGMTAYGLGHRLGIDEDDAAELVDRYHAAYPVARAWTDGMAAHARTYGRIATPYGWEMHVSRQSNPPHSAELADAKPWRRFVEAGGDRASRRWAQGL
jgi:DNA polymerase I